jgi:signal transduction histidine kinase
MMKNKAKAVTHPSFKRQLLSIFMLLVISMTIITSALTAWQSSKTISEATIENGLQITSNFAEQTVLALLTASVENGQEAIDRVLGFKSVDAVAVYRETGEVLLVSDGMSLNKRSLNLEKLTATNQLLIENEKFWVFTAKVTYSDDSLAEEEQDPEETEAKKQHIGHVFVQYNKQALHQVQQSIFINNTLTGIIIALLLALIMRLIISHMVTPLQTLSQTMDIARDTGKYPKAEITGARELRQIAQAYNQMMTILEHQNIALAKSHDTLESEVEIRTQELIVARDSAMTASRHKSEFLATMSHELRTPLQAIIGYTDLVREDLELECMDVQVEDLNKSIRSAHSLLALINNILDLAKIEAGRMDLHLKSVNIKNLVHEAIDTVKPMAQAKSNEITVNIGKLSPTLTIDRQKLMQIFLNLLSNACKFTKNGTINFDINNDQSFLYFCVSDTGVGIPKNKLNYIFEHFTQVDASQTRQFEGTGLGMAITQNFCHLMGGNLSVESQLNQGSIFSVKLPLKVI